MKTTNKGSYRKTIRQPGQNKTEDIGSKQKAGGQNII
jgi:hypothetical protein